MLKIEHESQTVNSSGQLLCCFDVSKASLSLYAQYPSGTDSRRIEESVPNQTGAIEELLARLAELAEEARLEGLLVLAEATGGYERKLLETAQEI